MSHQGIEFRYESVEIFVGSPRQVFPLFVVFQSAIFVDAFKADDNLRECCLWIVGEGAVVLLAERSREVLDCDVDRFRQVFLLLGVRSMCAG